MLVMGYWYLGNRQAFFNKYSLVEVAYGETIDPQHPLFDYSAGPDHTIPLLIFIPIVLFHKRFIKVVTKLFECMHILKMKSFKKVTEEDNDIDEKLGNYNNCLTGMDQMSWFAHEEYLR